jgi:hypothetical protein
MKTPMPGVNVAIDRASRAAHAAAAAKITKQDLSPRWDWEVPAANLPPIQDTWSDWLSFIIGTLIGVLAAGTLGVIAVNVVRHFLHS